MAEIAKLIISAVLPVLLSVWLYRVVRSSNNWLARRTGISRQLLIGLIFGAAAVLGTEFGVEVDGAVLNVRNASVLCAGLIFGGPAGIFAGIIGGVERWFAALWGAGVYTQLGCSAATILAGLFGALLRRFIFGDRIPAWYYGLLAGLFIEVVDMLLIMLTHMSDITGAFRFVRICSLPMICLNGAVTAAAVAVVTRIGKVRLKGEKSLKTLSRSFIGWLSIVIGAAFLLTTIFTWILETQLARTNALTLLQQKVQDAETEVEDRVGLSLLNAAQALAVALDSTTASNLNLFLDRLAWEYEIPEINLVNEDGIIAASTNEDYIGYNMASGAQSAEFLVLLDDAESFLQEAGLISFDNATNMQYAGTALSRGGFVQVGMDAERLIESYGNAAIAATRNWHIGGNGTVILADSGGRILSSAYPVLKSISDIVPAAGGIPEPYTEFRAVVAGTPCLCVYDTFEGYICLAALPVREAYLSRDIYMYLTCFMSIVVYVLLFLLLYILISRLVVDRIREVNATLAEITGGNLNVIVDVRSNEEFASLSDDINATVDTLKRYISEAETRIDQELEFARTIQRSSLRSIFPPYPDRTEFDIYAAMQTAREVGGDFYDFYFVAENRMALVIADVSDKGIPAAMFMMSAKSILKNLAESGLGVGQVLTRANDELCENNEASMFVTVWMGIVNLDTGVVEYANAGHNPPVVSSTGGGFSFLNNESPDLVLGALGGIAYTEHTFRLQNGGRIFLYTDGITEAVNEAGQMYGEKRLEEILNRDGQESCASQCGAVLKSVDEFSGSAAQADDITMMAFELRSLPMQLKELSVVPVLENLAQVTDFAETAMMEAAVPMDVTMKMCVVVDEIFSNIAHYSGASSLSFGIGVEEDTLTMQFEDDGIPYDPTLQAEPDLELSAEDREIGGLGIVLVRKMMNTVEYQYSHGVNILTLRKHLP